MLLSHFTCHSFKLDFMRIKFEMDPYFDILQNFCSFVDDDNSNYAIKWWLEEEFLIERVRDFYTLRPVGFPLTVMRLDFRAGDTVTIDFYGAFFSWKGYINIMKILSPSSHRIYRVDLAMDLIGGTPEQISKYADNKLPINTIKNKQTIYFGDWKSNRKIIRLYDKKADIIKKGKQEIHEEIFLMKQDVTRLEIELRSRACNDWALNLRKLEDPEFLYHIFYKELTTKHVWFPLPKHIDISLSRPSFKRGVPQPVLRFQEAIETALKKNVDIYAEVIKYCT